MSADLFDYLECSNQEIAHGLSIAVKQLIGEEKTKSSLLNLQIPVTADEFKDWEELVDKHQEVTLEKAMDAALNDLDQIVGECLGLDSNDILEIQRDLKTDAFLKGIRPRYPGTVTRKQGFRTGLDSEYRYE